MKKIFVIMMLVLATAAWAQWNESVEENLLTDEKIVLLLCVDSTGDYGLGIRQEGSDIRVLFTSPHFALKHGIIAIRFDKGDVFYSSGDVLGDKVISFSLDMAYDIAQSEQVIMLVTTAYQGTKTLIFNTKGLQPFLNKYGIKPKQNPSLYTRA